VLVHRVLPSASGVIALAVLTLVLFSKAWGQTEKALYSFTGGSDGGTPEGVLVFDALGNLYGTTVGGNGVVFQLSPNQDGTWAETTIHAFTDQDGYEPFAGLTLDSDGNLFGTTLEGGRGGCGTVFKLTPAQQGWHHRYYSFANSSGSCEHGFFPTASVTLDGSGNLFGTTDMGGDLSCGVDGCGVIFQLSKDFDYIAEKLHRFRLNGAGTFPQGPLTLDVMGNLFGTTSQGGMFGGVCNVVGFGGCGTVFELMKVGDGEWTGKGLHHFTGGADGAFPAYGKLIFVSAGNIYGTAAGGGYQGGGCATFGGCGVVFELSPTSEGWREMTLYTFTGGSDGGKPAAGVVLDSLGNLYGTTSGGGMGPCTDQGIPGCGVVYELTPNGDTWTQRVLYSFTGGNDGSEPVGGVTLDAGGNIYGTTQIGGAYDNGVVFEITRDR
jgi:uncharacterized repeat protein (TIGR03803 family)